MLIDTHAHLDFDDFDPDRDDVLERAKANGVGAVIIPGIDLKSSRAAIELAGKYDMLSAAVGIHPNSVSEALPGDNLEISRLAESPHVVAIGEIGLDFYRDRSPKDLQVRAFKGQLELASERDLPVIIHFRNVEMNGVEMIGVNKLKQARGVFHCFGGSPEFAKVLLDWGFYIGFDGPLTYKKSDRAEVAALVPLNRCLLETDAPFLTPQSNRGRRNEPSYVREIAEKLAEIKQIDIDEVIEVTGDNARRLFGL